MCRYTYIYQLSSFATSFYSVRTLLSQHSHSVKNLAQREHLAFALFLGGNLWALVMLHLLGLSLYAWWPSVILDSRTE